MLDKLDFIVEKYKELEAAVSKPEIIGNQPLWQKYIKEMSDMEPIVKTYSSFKSISRSSQMQRSFLQVPAVMKR